MYENLLNSHTFLWFCKSSLSTVTLIAKHQALVLSGQTYKRASGRRTLTQKQRHLTVWRREACPPLCLERAAGWFLGPGDTASRWGSSVCLPSGCTTRKHAEGFVRVWWFAVSCCQVIKYVTWLHFHHSAFADNQTRLQASLLFYWPIAMIPSQFLTHLSKLMFHFCEKKKKSKLLFNKGRLGVITTMPFIQQTTYNILMCEL